MIALIYGIFGKGARVGHAALGLCALLAACGGSPPAPPPPPVTEVAPAAAPAPTPGSPMPDVGSAAAPPIDAMPAAPVRLVTGRVQPMPPGAPATAAYFTLERTAPGPLALVRALSPAAAAVELHEHTAEGGMMMMRPVQGPIPVPAEGPLVFQPGGYHVMLIGLRAPLAAGDTVPLSLLFDDGSAARLQLTVAAP
ncbi:MAG: copper chaperone PCu(A)C [Deltaproteobacteria bacterium]|nr:copper chaperone PCu(A)C [Deltaproteobacteria bacterium]